MTTLPLQSMSTTILQEKNSEKRTITLLGSRNQKRRALKRLIGRLSDGRAVKLVNLESPRPEPVFRAMITPVSHYESHFYHLNYHNWATTDKPHPW